jgi:hypothetical protein
LAIAESTTTLIKRRITLILKMITQINMKSIDPIWLLRDYKKNGNRTNEQRKIRVILFSNQCNHCCKQEGDLKWALLFGY